MSRPTIITTVALAALATTVAPALAGEMSYEQHDVRSNPKEGPGEHVTLDVPDTWDRDRLNRFTVSFSDSEAHRGLVVDLDPHYDTARKMRAEAQVMRDLGPAYYREHDFRVNDEDEKVRVRWVFAYRDAQTEDRWWYTSVLLIDDERVFLDGELSDKEELKQIRKRVVGSFQIQE